MRPQPNRWRATIFAIAVAMAMLGLITLTVGTLMLTAELSGRAEREVVDAAIDLSFLGLAFITIGSLVTGIIRYRVAGIMLALTITFVAIGTAALWDASAYRDVTILSLNAAGDDGASSERASGIAAVLSGIAYVTLSVAMITGIGFYTWKRGRDASEKAPKGPGPRP